MLSKADIQTEIDLRVAKEINLKRLVVDYYRVRYKVSFPLPVTGDFMLSWKVRFDFLDQYLWSIWLMFRLEERFYALAAGSMNNKSCQIKFEKELEVFCQWKAYRQLEDKPDLSVGHCGRILYSAYNELPWASIDLKKKIKGAAQNLVDESIDLGFKHYSLFQTKKDILNSEKPWLFLHNIPFIGCVGIFLCMDVLGDERKFELLKKLESIIDALLDFSLESNYSEGVCYDGYIFDFIIDLFPFLNIELQKKLRGHETVQGWLKQSYGLSLPGHMANFAEIGDVEPFQLLFHQSACLRWQAISPSLELQYYLNRLDNDKIPAKGLFDAIRKNNDIREVTPKSGVWALPATYCLRTGWGVEDFVVGASCSKSAAGHIQYDAGTITYGTNKNWFLVDPGYQQYMNTSERVFTYSKVSHNCPLINGVSQSKKLSDFIESSENKNGCQASFDLSKCYDLEGLECKRSLDLTNRGKLQVTDELNKKSDLLYYWHFNAKAGLYIENGKLIIDIDGDIMTVACSKVLFEGSNLSRLKGSRGQVTLSVELQSIQEVDWFFEFN